MKHNSVCRATPSISLSTGVARVARAGLGGFYVIVSSNRFVSEGLVR
jgi:hypothetical protein